MRLRSIEIQNFRCFRDFHLDFDDTTVLIGENNSGKTALLDAIRLCLRDAAQVRRTTNFEHYDVYLADGTADPTRAQPIQITLSFRESKPDEWDNRVVRSLRAIVQTDPATRLNEVVLRCTCQYDAETNDYPPAFAFLNLACRRLRESA